MVSDPAYEEVVVKEPTVEQRLAFYATYRGIGGAPIPAYDALAREQKAHTAQ